MFSSGNSVNQIPGECTVAGDCRVTPFYDLSDVIASINADVDDINAHLDKLPTRGPVSTFELPAQGLRGRLEVTWGEGTSRGIACDITSPGFAAMAAAFSRVTGKCEPMSITGSLPCIRDLQEAGFDVQTLGFGLSAYHSLVALRRSHSPPVSFYHAVDERASLAQIEVGWRVLSEICNSLLM